MTKIKTSYCLTCGKEFSYYKTNSFGKYCSKKCYGNSISGKQNNNWNGGKSVIKCDFCGKEINDYVSQTKQYKTHFCNMKCYTGWQSKHNCLQNNSNWNGGKSFEPYPLVWNEKLREIIRKRDGRECQLCNNPENGIKLTIHHIDYDKKNCDPLNLISLCHDCHVKTNFNRPYWKEYFNPQPGLELAV